MGNVSKYGHCLSLIKEKWNKMVVKALLILSVQAVLIQGVYTQCIGSPLGPEIITNLPFVDAYGPSPSVSRIIGANLLIDTSTPHELSGVSIYSDDLLIDGAVYVEGNLPFVGTVALEGVLPATGTSLVSYGCGDGDVEILEALPPAGLAVLPPGGQGWLGLGGIPPLGRL